MKIEKKPVRSVAFTHDYKISGTVHLHIGDRYSEFINYPEKYIPVTDAQIFIANIDKLIYKTKFLSLNKDSLICILPVEQA